MKYGTYFGYPFECKLYVCEVMVEIVFYFPFYYKMFLVRGMIANKSYVGSNNIMRPANCVTLKILNYKTTSHNDRLRL